MKQVQKTIGRWVQRIVGKADAEKQARTARRPAELDAQSLRQVSGGNAETPVKGW